MPKASVALPRGASGPSRATSARLLAPRASLGGCVRAYICRSTLGADLLAHERLNFFPATPMCSITWFVQGEAVMAPVAEPEQVCPMPGPVMFSGPHTEPYVCSNPGPVQVFMLAFMPDALAALTGVDVAASVDRVVPLSQVLDAEWCAMAQRVLHAQSDAERVQQVEAFLEPRWQAARHGGAVRTGRFHDWMQSLAVRLAASGAGQSLRQVERRIKAHAGLSLRHLRHFSRAEAVFFEARSGHADAPVDWAGVAAQTGFSDQAHLCREVRRVSGLSPAELHRRVECDEAFWIYRIWS